MLEMVLKAEILLFFSIQISASHRPDVPDHVTVVNWQRRCEAISRIRSELGSRHYKRCYLL